MFHTKCSCVSLDTKTFRSIELPWPWPSGLDLYSEKTQTQLFAKSATVITMIQPPGTGNCLVY